MEEKWVKIDDWEGYEVSGRAHVRSYRDRYGFKKDKFLDEPTQLKIQTNKDGYEFVRLMRNRKQKKAYLHDLIGRAFIPNPDDKPEINHKNGIKNDNRIENLQWVTRAENMEHARRTGLIDKEKTRAATLEACHREVYCYEDDMHFYTAAEAAERYGVSRSSITLCCQGKIHSIKGLHFCYSEDTEELCNNIEEYQGLSSNFKRLKAINVETGEERIYSSRKEASSDLKIPDSYISNIIAGRPYKTRGWTFENFPPKLDKR